MTDEELNTAVNKLISEANEDSEDAKLEYEENCRKARYRAAENRTLRSSILDSALEKLKETYDRLVQRIQQELDESLEALYAENYPDGVPGEGINPDDAPYEVDYSLPSRDRYVTVKNYYMAYDDMAQALLDFQRDEIAKDYLGTYYDYLLQLLLLMQN